MKAKDIPFNMEIEYDAELNEVPKDLKSMREGLNWLKEKISQLENPSSPEQKAEKAGLLSLFGGYGRVLNHTNESEDALRQALTFYEELGKETYVLALNLRLAATLTYARKRGAATKIFESSIQKLSGTKSPQLLSQLDYALFHYGKLLLDQQMFQQALDNFLECLELRISQGDVKSIQVAEQAIAKVRTKIE